MEKLLITLKRSKYGRTPKHRATLAALGLRKINQSVIKEDSPQLRGMIREVSYLIEVRKVK